MKGNGQFATDSQVCKRTSGDDSRTGNQTGPTAGDTAGDTAYSVKGI